MPVGVTAVPGADTAQRLSLYVTVRQLKARITSKHSPNFYKGLKKQLKKKISVCFLSSSGFTTIKLTAVPPPVAVKAGGLPGTGVQAESTSPHIPLVK